MKYARHALRVHEEFTKENHMQRGWVWAVLGLMCGLGASVLAQEPALNREEVLKKYDTNKDGKLSAEERDALPGELKERIQKFLAQQGKPPAQPKLPENVIVEREVTYGMAGNRPLTLDVFKPKNPGAERLPVVVWIHGGGWKGGDKSSGAGRVAPYVATGNYVGISVGYRLTGEAQWPAQIHDCKAAIRWVREHADDLKIDPNKIGVWGSSAGGHLVSLLGTGSGIEALEGNNGSPKQSSRVTCVVDYCGPSDFLAFAKTNPSVAGPNSPVAALFGAPLTEREDMAREASPATHASKDDPPFLIVHGTEDPTVNIAQAEILHEKLTAAGVDVTMIRMVNGGHGFGGPELDARVAAFFARHLRGTDATVSNIPIEVPRAPEKK